jgi:transposase
MANTLLIAKTERAVAQGREQLTDEQVSFLGSAYAGAIAQGRAENPRDRHGQLPRAGKLVERFATHRNMILRFTVDFAVPFTNNQAEVRHQAARSEWTRRREGRQMLMSVA